MQVLTLRHHKRENSIYSEKCNGLNLVAVFLSILVRSLFAARALSEHTK